MIYDIHLLTHDEKIEIETRAKEAGLTPANIQFEKNSWYPFIKLGDDFYRAIPKQKQ